MEELRRQFRWMSYPQLFVGFIVLCLCIAAMGNILRATASTASAGLPFKSPVHVRGAHTAAAGALPDCNAKPCIALSFDDGPSPTVTPHVLDILAAEHVHATFFMVGMHAQGNEALVRRVYEQGNEVGNHSWDHADFTKLSPAMVDQEIQKTQAAIVNAGVPAPRLFRPPYGAVNSMVLSHVRMSVVRWDIDPGDWEVKDTGKVVASVLAHARPGGIVLMHDLYPTTADALTPIIETLKPHYQFVTVSQLMNLAPGDQGQYFGRWIP